MKELIQWTIITIVKILKISFDLDVKIENKRLESVNKNVQ